MPEQEIAFSSVEESKQNICPSPVSRPNRNEVKYFLDLYLGWSRVNVIVVVVVVVEWKLLLNSSNLNAGMNITSKSTILNWRNSSFQAKLNLSKL